MGIEKSLSFPVAQSWIFMSCSCIQTWGWTFSVLWDEKWGVERIMRMTKGCVKTPSLIKNAG